MASFFRIETAITQHTLWQALTGTTPPMGLPARPISVAALDSRAVEPGALFVALSGTQTDGHRYIEQAIANGAAAIICERRGLPALQQAQALIIRADQEHFTAAEISVERPDPALARRPIAYVVTSSVGGLQAVGAFQRLHRTHPDLRTVGITGSVGKTSTKELAASVLSQRYNTFRTQGNLNSEEGMPLSMLGLDLHHERAVLEMGMYAVGEIRLLCQLGRPTVGVVTNVEPVHLERLGTIERIAQAKAELIQSLPSAADGGTAILNWDDPRVQAMAQMTDARIFRYGLTPEAELWATEIESSGLEGIRFRIHHRDGRKKVQRFYVKVPLLGRHSVHTALRAAAVGVVEGLTWPEIIAGLQRTTGQLRLVLVKGINDSTIIDDTYNASPTSTLAALNLLADLQNGAHRRTVAVLGDMRELGSFEQEGHQSVGIRAAGVADLLVTVGELGHTIGEAALEAGMDAGSVFMFAHAEEAIAQLNGIIQPKDLVLVKGSRAVGMDDVVQGIREENPEKQGL